MTGSKDRARSELELAETVRAACVRAAIDGYEDAAISGLCREGAWEAAISAIETIDLDALLRARPERQPPGDGGGPSR